MTSREYQRVRELFHQACELDAAARSSFLEQACAGDPGLRSRVEALLEQDDIGNGPLGDTAVPLGQRVLAATQREEGECPERIGRYRIVRRIGVGGMGVVYAAEQDRPRRCVALKVIRRDLSSTAMRRRFELEAEMLGRLLHPGIAQIYEAGAADLGHGPQPYIAMELVDGPSLCEYAEKHRLAIRERLALFVKVADAVHHAHQRGVIHRDLKPANILVVDECGVQNAECGITKASSASKAAHDSSLITHHSSLASAQPKVLDFGIARALHCDHVATTVQTAVGQLIGTLPYMSPEQVTGDTADLDTRSDVYALGVVLYELLTGQLPYALSGRTLPEAARIIREEEPRALRAAGFTPALPPKLRGYADRKSAGTEGAQGGSLKPAARPIDADIETIVAKALEKDKQRRYQSAAELALDIRRHLAGEPIEARRDSTWYVLRKMVNRHRVPAAAATGFVLLLVASSVVAWTLRGQARRAELEATEAADGERLARATAEDALYESLVAQARAVRHTGRTGQRFEALDVLRRAAAIRPSLELRNEAIAAMSLTDVRRIDTPVARRTGIAVTFDANVEHCALFQEDFSAVVARVRDDVEWAAIPPPEPQTTGGFHRLVRGYYLRVCIYGTAERRLDVWRLPDTEPSAGEFPSAAGRGETLGRAPVRILEIVNLPYQGLFDVSDDERFLAVSQNDSAIHIYELDAAREVRRVELESDPKYLSFAPDGRRIAVFHGDFASKACVVDLDSGRQTPVFEGSRISWSIAWHPDGRRIAGPDGSSVLLWDLAQGRSLGKLPAAHSNTVTEVQFDPGGQTLVTKGWDGTPVIWDAQLFLRLMRVPGEVWASGPGQFSADGRWMAGTDSRSGILLSPVVYEVAEKAEMFRLVPEAAQTAAEDTARLSHGKFSPDGRLLFVFATADDDRLSGMYVFDVLGRREAARVPSSGFGEVALDPGGRFVLLAGATGLWYWPLSAEGGAVRLGPPRRILETPDLTEVQISDSGRVAVVHGDGPSELLLFDLHAPQQAALVEKDSRRLRFALSVDGRSLATAVVDGESALRDGLTGRVIASLPGRHVSLALSPDGRWLATSDLLELCLWDVAGARQVRRIATTVDECAFSTDGTLLAVRAGLTRIRMLRVDTLEEIASLEAPEMAPNSFTFSPDGTLLAAFMARNLATCVWDLREVRAHLAELGLDWDLPPYLPAEATSPTPMHFEIDWGAEWPTAHPLP